MSLFDEETKNTLKKHLQKLMDDVNIIYFGQEGECESCQTAQNFLEEIAELSEKINLEAYNFADNKDKANNYGIDKVPAIVLADSNKQDTGIRFYGIPAGHEINSFVKALLEVSGAKEELSADAKERIAALDKDVNIQVFVTLQCPYCSTAVETANRLALENDQITANMVESSTFSELAAKYNVSGVPKVVINESTEFVGAQPMEVFLEKIESL